MVMGMEPSIFTRIISGEIPCHKIYEDEKTIAFLDIHPIQPGHTLVVPKAQVDHFDDLAESDYQALWLTVQKISKLQRRVLGRTRTGLKVVGLDVPHAHVHVFPIDNLGDYTTKQDMSAEPNHAELAAMAEKLRSGAENE